METEDNENSSRHNYSTYYYDELNPFEFSNMHRNRFFYFINIGCPIAIFGGVCTNILAFVVLVRNRLWLKHEGYVYLAANFCTNVGILLFCTSTIWLTSNYSTRIFEPSSSSNFTCKIWHFLMNIFFASGWLSVALLFNVYLREHLTHRRRCGCPIFAAKYCTLFASKIIVGVIFGVLFVLGLPYLALFELRYDIICLPSSNRAFAITLIIETILMWVLPIVFFLPIILVITLCTKEGSAFGFSQIEERSVSHEQMKVVAVILSSMTLFSQFIVAAVRVTTGGYSVTGALMDLAHGLSTGLQPILCFIILTMFRDEFRSQLRSIRCCRRLFPSLDRDEEVVQLSAIQEDVLNTAET